MIRTIRPAALLAAFLTLLPVSVRAVGTDPTLALTSVRVLSAADGSRSLSITGTFGFEDQVQFSFPLGVIVYRGTSFVRSEFSGQPYQGVASSLANGIQTTDVAGILASGSPAPAPAKLLDVSSDRVSLALPAGFGSGSATVVVYSVFEGEAFLSNTLTVTLP